MNYSQICPIMPSVICIGVRVSGAVGPLPHDRPESSCRKWAVWTRIVIGSMPDESWLVLWDPTGQATIHSYCSIKFVEYSTFTEVKLQEMQQRFLSPQNAVVQLQSTSAISKLAAAVEQEGASLVSVAEVAAALNEAILQLPPAAASMPEELGNAEGNQANNATLDINSPDDEPPQEVEQVPIDPDGEESEQLCYDGLVLLDLTTSRKGMMSIVENGFNMSRKSLH